MKKIALSIVFGALMTASLAAYNPPAGGESLFNLSSPKNLSGGATAAGGPIFSATADSLNVNPALTGREQRVALNAGYTALFSSESKNESNFGSAAQLGILIPTRYFVFSGYTNGTFIDFYEMHVGNSFNARAGLAKEIMENLVIGLSANGGFAWGHDSDWLLGANVGALYTLGDLGFLKDFRIGASVLNLGKNYKDLKLFGMDATESISDFPTFLTLKGGVAASVFRNDTLDIAVAADVTTPFFQNIVLDFAAGVAIKDMVFVNVMETVNFREIANSHKMFIPAIGVSFKFDLNFHGNSYAEKNDWADSEMVVSGAFKTMYDSVYAVSGGADLYLGKEDTDAPEIHLFGDDED